jgi:putative transposase
VAAKYNAEIMAFELMPDNLHLLCQIAPQFGIHRLVNNIKGVSSDSLRKEFSRLRSRIPTLWTHRYLVSTVGGAAPAVIQPSVENQKNV